MLADELSEAKSANGARRAAAPVPSQEDEDLLVAAVDHLAERIQGIAGRLGRA
jgi:hypothetical protein